MPKRWVPAGNQLRVLNARRLVPRTSPPSKSRAASSPDRHAKRVESAQRLTLVLGLARGEGRPTTTGGQLSSGNESPDADPGIVVNMKLKDASISVIEAAQVLADSCFCQSHEAVMLDRMLGVIDELDDLIRALHARERQVLSDSGPMIGSSAGDRPSGLKVFVPPGRGSIFHTTIPTKGTDPTNETDQKSGGTALKAEDADTFLAALIAGPEDESPSLTSVCRSATRLLRMSGSSVVLMGESTFPSVASAYGVSVTVQDLEFTLGEGPAGDAFTQGSPVLVDDVSAFSSRWPQFTRAIADEGVHSLYAFPLQLGAIKLGVLVLYRDEPGVLQGDELSAAHLVANLVTNQVLDMQAGALSESLAWGIEVDDYRAVVHQASGMISAQLDCAMGEALVRLRGRAFATDRPIDLVAADVVTGIVRFDEP